MFTGKGRDAVELRLVPVGALLIGGPAVRGEDEDGAVEDLAASIRRHGVLQPILVRPVGSGYEVVAGRRRVRACKQLGLKVVPALVRPVPDEAVRLLGVVENVERRGLHWLDEAAAWLALEEERGWDHEELGAAVGRSAAAVAESRSLLQLSGPAAAVVRRAGLTAAEARVVLSLTDDDARRAWLVRAARAGWTARQLRRRLALAGVARRTGRRVRMVRDVRIFLNTFRAAVRGLQDTGVRAELCEQERGDWWELTVRVAKAAGSPGGRGRARMAQPGGGQDG